MWYGVAASCERSPVRYPPVPHGRVVVSGPRTRLSCLHGSEHPHGAGPDLHRMPGTRHETRVVAGDCRLGRARPTGRRTRSWRHRGRTGCAPAPHPRVLRARGAPESLLSCPQDQRGQRGGADQHTARRLPRLARTPPVIDRQKLEQQLMSTR